MLAELRELDRGKHTRAKCERSHEDRYQGREQSLGASTVECREAEVTAGKLGEDHTGNQEAGNNEEDVNADETSRQLLGRGVIKHNGEHRNGAQAIDVRTVPCELRHPSSGGVSA